MDSLNQYELEGVIGRGSMGAVYRARRTDGRVVALKMLRWAGEEQVIRRLRQEVAALVDLGHPNILKVLEVIADEDALVIAMDLAGRGSLADVLRRSDQLPPEEAVALVAKVADALDAIHALDIVHGDVKTSNVLMDGVWGRHGEPLLSDIGLSRWTSAPSAWCVGMVGTAEYLDPGVVEGASPGPASDVYSLGVMCYELLARRLPYRGVTPMATLRAADQGNAEPLVLAAPGVSTGLAAIVELAMSRRPVERPGTAAELADALRTELDKDGMRRLTSQRVECAGNSAARDVSSATGPRAIRPRNRSREPWPERRRHDRRANVPLVTAAGATLLVVVALTGWTIGHLNVAKGASNSCPATTTTVTRYQTGPDSGATTLLADVAGHGCRVPVMWLSGVMTVSAPSGRPTVRFALGQPGDELLLGEWDCHRGATPALYRPATGEVFYFSAWARSGLGLAPSRDDATTITNGVPRVVRNSLHGCDHVAVARPSGFAS